MQTTRIIISIALAAAVAGPGLAFADSCIDCHSELPEPLGTPAEGFPRDVHAAAGFSCADCHGGDPTVEGEEAMSKAAGFVGKPEPAEIPEFCGKCHANKRVMRRYDAVIPTTQLEEYWTSGHGMALRKGNTKVATCISCHGVHGIRAVSDAEGPVHKTNVAQTCGHCHADAAYMEGTGLPTTQLAQYVQSVHGKRLIEERDAAAPTCNNCHGNHGAAPPGADSVGAVCGTCHVIQHDLFAESGHREAFEQLGLFACSNHHGAHDVARTSDAMVGTSEGSTCTQCHADGTAELEVARSMSTSIAALRATLASATGVLADAADAGMEVSEAEYGLKTAHDALIQARNLVHTAKADRVRDAAESGLRVAKEGEEIGRNALAELRSRKTMALIPLGMIAIVCVLLYMKIRSLGGRLGRDR